MTWNELPSGIQDRFLIRAQFLIDNGYVLDRTVQEVAEDIYLKQQDKVLQYANTLVVGHFL